MTGSPLTAAALLAAAVATVAIGAYGVRLLPHHLRLPGRLTQRRAAVECRRDLRRIPFGRIVSRRRRADRQVRRRRAVVSGRLHRRLSGAAAVRRRTAAPVGRVHRARLRRVPARLGTAAQGRDARRRGDLRVLSGAAVSGRRSGAENATRRAGLDRTAGGRRYRHRQRRRGRDALDHVRAGIPVLAEADRDRHPRAGAARAVLHRPRRTGRSHATDGSARYDCRNRDRRGGAGRRTGRHLGDRGARRHSR